MNKIRNIYEDEEVKLAEKEKDYMRTVIQLAEVLDRNGYFLQAELEDGLPKITLLKL